MHIFVSIHHEGMSVFVVHKDRETVMMFVYLYVDSVQISLEALCRFAWT